MSNLHANQPLPFAQPIRIVDVSPYRRSLRRRPTESARARRVRDRIGAVLAGAALALLFAAVASAAGQAAGDFRLSPGNAMPVALQDEPVTVSDPARKSSAEFRLGPGHVMPPSLAH